MLKTLVRWTASALLAGAMASASAAQIVPGSDPTGSPPAALAAPVQLPVDALMQDAGEYARLFGVPFDEALRRLRAQGDSVPATDAIRETFKDRWAGIAIEHVPSYRIVVLLTGTDPVPDQSIVAGGMTVPIVFRTGATATREAVLAAITTYQAKIRDSLPHPPGLGVDQRTGELVVMTASADVDRDRNDALRARIAAMTGVPVRIDVVDRPPVDMQAATAPAAPDVAAVPSGAIEGGGHVVGTVDGKRYACTTGFVVSDGIRNGVVTAAHCPDTLSYVGKRPADGRREEWPLAFVGQWGWGYQDVQVNVATAPGVGYAPLFYADTARTLARPVATWRYRTSTRAGDFVCHRGERTGYSCAVVAMVDFAPAGDLCGGACLPTWVAVEGPTCKAGDSGAPVFEGTTALGIVKGGTYRRDGTCLFYYYMSTDYLPQGWTLLHQ